MHVPTSSRETTKKKVERGTLSTICRLQWRVSTNVIVADIYYSHTYYIGCGPFKYFFVKRRVKFDLKKAGYTSEVSEVQDWISVLILFNRFLYYTVPDWWMVIIQNYVIIKQCIAYKRSNIMITWGMCT